MNNHPALFQIFCKFGNSCLLLMSFLHVSKVPNDNLPRSLAIYWLKSLKKSRLCAISRWQVQMTGVARQLPGHGPLPSLSDSRRKVISQQLNSRGLYFLSQIGKIKIECTQAAMIHYKVTDEGHHRGNRILVIRGLGTRDLQRRVCIGGGVLTYLVLSYTLL